MHNWTKRTLGLFLLAGLVGLLWGEASLTRVSAQQATGTALVESGTSGASYITVTYTDGANVRAGPSSFDYPEVGPRMNPGDTAPALGRSPGGDWIEIAYPGAPGNVAWVYAALVSLSSGPLPIVDPPPTSTPATTSTVDLTMVAAFPSLASSTALPTFTAPPPLETPTSVPILKTRSGLPAGFIVLGLFILGALGIMITFLHRR